MKMFMARPQLACRSTRAGCHTYVELPHSVELNPSLESDVQLLIIEFSDCGMIEKLEYPELTKYSSSLSAVIFCSIELPLLFYILFLHTHNNPTSFLHSHKSVLLLFPRHHFNSISICTTESPHTVSSSFIFIYIVEWHATHKKFHLHNSGG